MLGERLGEIKTDYSHVSEKINFKVDNLSVRFNDPFLTDLKNVNFDSVSSVTVTATAVYPRYLAGFYDADNGGGNLLVDYNEPTISGTITLTASTFTDKTAIYAHFIDAHA